MKLKCAVVECSSEHDAKGYCKKHYQRWRTHGDPLLGRTRYKTPEEAFAARTEWQGDCLLWVGSKGYATTYGNIHVKGRDMKAYRYAYTRVHGPIAPGMVIDHICHNPPCVNVKHLRAITHAENIQNQRGPRVDNKSGYRNVYWHEKSGKWVVLVAALGKSHYGGLFEDIEDANQHAIHLRSVLHIETGVDSL